jgi:hypothetical protein
MKISPNSGLKVFVVAVLVISVHLSGCKHDVQAGDLKFQSQSQCNQESLINTASGNDDSSIDIFTDEVVEVDSEDCNCLTDDNALAQVPRLKQLVNTKITTAQQICAENQIDISQLRKKLNEEGLDVNEKEVIEEDIDWKQDYISLLEKMIHRLTKCRTQIERAEMMIADFDRVQGIIDVNFLAEVDQAIRDMDRLIHRS